MGFKEQLQKLKENWLLAGIIMVLFMFMFLGNLGSMTVGNLPGSKGYAMDSLMENSRYGSYTTQSYYPSDSDFAPEVEERKIVKTSSISTKIERGVYKSAEQQLKNIVSSSDGFILNENVRNHGSEKKSYYQGTYSIKVASGKYDAVVSQLKEIGEVQSFTENARDITGSYTNLGIEIGTEKSRLQRYEQLYNQLSKAENKKELIDDIFDQERKIQYLEYSLENMDSKVEYSSISVSMAEKRSEYADIVFVKFSNLIRSLVGSSNTLLHLVFVILPWATFILITRFVWRLMKKKE